MVRTNTLVLPGSDAAVLRIKENGKAIAMSVDGNGRYCYLDPFMGGQLVVAEAARNVAVSGAEPIGCTDCLNFGSPQDPEIMWQFAEVVKGMALACRELGIPVISGNVSLYNESPKRAIDPTPIVGVVGLIEAVKIGKKNEIRYATQAFKSPGDAIYLAGESKNELGGSEYLQHICGHKAGRPPQISLKSELALQRFLVAAVRAGLVASAHDLSDGGLAVALAESCLGGGDSALGADVRLEWPLRPDALLFGETASRALLSSDPSKEAALGRLALKFGVPFRRIGTVAVGSLRLRSGGGEHKADLEASLDEMRRAWCGTFDIMKRG
jgi:phosphoribosylformylglycinamidine synthase